MEITLPKDCRDEYKARASVVFSILDALEAGQPPADWIEQLDRAGIGSIDERWQFARFLGAKACEVQWLTREVHFQPRAYYWPQKYELVGPAPQIKLKRFSNPGFYEPTTKRSRDWDVNITDCIETAAKVAFVTGRHKAVRACLKGFVEQITSPTVKGVVERPEVELPGHKGSRFATR